MPTDIDIITLSAQGDDRSLSKNGDDRYYWYSVRDMMTLLVKARRDHLRYENDATIAPPIFEEYSPLSPNYQKLLIADPYHQINFATYLSDDINKIIGDGTHKFWRSMPEQIIIPLLSGGHWRAIRIQIFFPTKSVTILWDDPYGKGAFPQLLKDTLLDAIIPNINKLIVKAVGDSEFRLSLDNIVQVDKPLDQQGKGNNAWDCGPIIMSNIIDYIRHSTTENSSFYEYSISNSSQENHERQMIEIRNLHRLQYSKISGELLNMDRLISIGKGEFQFAEAFIDKLESFSHSCQQEIERLSPSKINLLFALIDSNRQSQEQGEEYSEQEVEKALECINHDITPISFDLNKGYFDVASINALLKEKKSKLHRLSFLIGSHNFSEITARGVDFVDKSIFIKEIIETGDKVTIITRPRRWGKTINMNMLSKFFAITVDEFGNAVVPSPYRDLFQRLRIGQEYPNLVDEHQGRYPVIFFTFKSIKLKTYQEIESQLISEIRELYDNYLYLYDSNKMSANKKEKFQKFLKGDNMAKKDIGESIKFLSLLLQKHHGKEVYILIDEYDAPLSATHDTEEYTDTLELMCLILGKALKDNDSLKKAVVTGVTKIALSDVNNAREYSILKSRYAEYFGFTEEEVEILLQRANITDIRIISAVTEYYNGYQIGDYTLYNPYSVACFLTDLQLSPYWVNTESSIAGARKLSAGLLMTPEMQSTVRDLIRNCYAKNKDTVEIVISPDVVLHKLKESPQAIWTVLAYGGYLSLSNRCVNDDLTETCSARIPNREVLGIYKQSISLWLTNTLGVDVDKVLGSSDVINIDDIEKFQTVVRKLLVVKNDLFGDANESLFHSFIIGLYFFRGGISHQLSSEKKAGSGRGDDIFYPIEGKSIKIIIHEYKILGQTDTAQIDSKLQDALWQVYEHYYFEEAVSTYKEFSYPHYQQLEIRGLVAFIDENTNVLGMRSASILHDISEISDSFLPLFKSLKADELRMLRTHYRIEEFIKEFRSVGTLPTILKQLESSDAAKVGSVLVRRSRSQQQVNMGGKRTNIKKKSRS